MPITNDKAINLCKQGGALLVLDFPKGLLFALLVKGIGLSSENGESNCDRPAFPLSPIKRFQELDLKRKS